MAVSSEVARVVHTANGTATFFSYAPIDGVTSANLKVYLFNPTTGVLTAQTLGTHYTFGGGGVTFNTAPPSGRRVILLRLVELLQPDLYKTNAPFPAAVTEKRFDEIVKGLQQLNDIAQNRAIILPLGDAGFSANVLPAVENRKGRVLYFNATTGDPEAKQLADTIIPAPAWAITFLSQSTAAAGLANIGGVAKAGDTMTGPLTLSGAPTAALHAATKAYVDAVDNAKVNRAGDTMTGALTLPGAPTATNHAATKGYVDTEVGTRVAKAGDTMTGPLTLPGAPTAANHAATKGYVDTEVGTRVAKAGDTMTGDLTISKLTPVIQISSPTVSFRGLRFSTNTVSRWELVTDSDTESGSNAGSTFKLRRYADSGASLGDVCSVERSSGRWTFLGVLPRVPNIDPVVDNDVVRKAYADRSGPGGSTGLIAVANNSIVEVNNIPDWANVIVIMFIEITGSSTEFMRVQLGTSSSFVQAGYISGYGTRGGEVNDNASFITNAVSSAPMNAIMTIYRTGVGSNLWIEHNVGSQGNYVLGGGAGRINIGAQLTRLRFYTAPTTMTGGLACVRWTA